MALQSVTLLHFGLSRMWLQTKKSSATEDNLSLYASIPDYLCIRCFQGN